MDSNSANVRNASGGPQDAASKLSSRYLMSKAQYSHPMKTYIYITLFIVGLMSALWFVVGIGPGAKGTIPPSFAFGPSDFYFHSIAIGIAALLVYFVMMAFNLDKYEPHIDFPIAYRATLATIIGAIGAAFYLQPIFNTELAPIPIALVTIGLLFLADVGGALLMELYLLPAKLSGRYDPSKNILGMFPRWNCLPSWQDLKKMDSAYWLTFMAIIAAFIGGMIGLISMIFNPHLIGVVLSPSFLNGYVSWMGGTSAFLGAMIGAHSHLIGMAVIIGAVAIVAKYFNVLNLTGLKRSVAKTGMWISIAGILLMTSVFILEAFTTVFPGAAPPLLLASNPGGFQLWSFTAQNGMAGDDTTMLIAAIGAMVMLAPLMLTKLKGRPAWKDPIRLSILATWIIAFIATPIEGFFIEFNEATLSGGAIDTVFGNLQYFALFGLLMLTLAFIAVDFFEQKERTRKLIAIGGIAVAIFTAVTGYIYAFFSPGVLNASGEIVGLTAWGWIFSIGLLAVSAVVIAAMVSVYYGKRIIPEQPQQPLQQVQVVPKKAFNQ